MLCVVRCLFLLMVVCCSLCVGRYVLCVVCGLLFVDGFSLVPCLLLVACSLAVSCCLLFVVLVFVVRCLVFVVCRVGVCCVLFFFVV